MSEQTIESHFADLTSAIEMSLSGKKHLPALILIYSTLDILAWLNRPSTHPDVTKCDFLAWVDQYLRPGPSLHCTPIDLYAARCGIIHSLQAESKLSREGKARQVWYSWGKCEVARLRASIRQAKLEKTAVPVQVEALFEALKSGITQFLESLEADPSHAKLVYDRARKKFFTDIPHELL
ncbi:MAG TPA: hypothetical protein VMX13_06005 [Sedimentisphaerales bacterium]|nr:hypothetical protein [Sedimentisphaerales bacterium]